MKKADYENKYKQAFTVKLKMQGLDDEKWNNSKEIQKLKKRQYEIRDEFEKLKKDFYEMFE